MEGLSERENLTASVMPTKILKNIPMVILVVDVLHTSHVDSLSIAYSNKFDSLYLSYPLRLLEHPTTNKFEMITAFS